LRERKQIYGDKSKNSQQLVNHKEESLHYEQSNEEQISGAILE